MVDRNRKKIEKLQETVDFEYYTLADARTEIDKLIENYGEDATIQEYRPAYSDSRYLAVYCTVDETDLEMNNRITREEIWEKDRNKRDQEEYERLKKKFEKGENK